MIKIILHAHTHIMEIMLLSAFVRLIGFYFDFSQNYGIADLHYTIELHENLSGNASRTMH